MSCELSYLSLKTKITPSHYHNAGLSFNISKDAAYRTKVVDQSNQLQTTVGTFLITEFCNSGDLLSDEIGIRTNTCFQCFKYDDGSVESCEIDLFDDRYLEIHLFSDSFCDDYLYSSDESEIPYPTCDNDENVRLFVEVRDLSSAPAGKHMLVQFDDPYCGTAVVRCR